MSLLVPVRMLMDVSILITVLRVVVTMVTSLMHGMNVSVSLHKFLVFVYKYAVQPISSLLCVLNSVIPLLLCACHSKH